MPLFDWFLLINDWNSWTTVGSACSRFQYGITVIIEFILSVCLQYADRPE